MASDKCPVCKNGKLEKQNYKRLGEDVYYCPVCHQEGTIKGLKMIAEQNPLVRERKIRKKEPAPWNPVPAQGDVVWRDRGEDYGGEEYKTRTRGGSLEIRAYLNEKKNENEIVAIVTSPFLFDGERKTPCVLAGSPGKYSVQVVYGNHTAEKKIEIKKGKNRRANFVFKEIGSTGKIGSVEVENVNVSSFKGGGGRAPKVDVHVDAPEINMPAQEPPNVTFKGGDVNVEGPTIQNEINMPDEIKIKSGETPCPNCMHLFQRPYPLTRVRNAHGPFHHGNLWHCRSCRLYFEEHDHRLIPIIHEYCEECSRQGETTKKVKRVANAPNRETGRIHTFFCPRHHNHLGCHAGEMMGVDGQVIADECYREWLHMRGEQIAQRVQVLRHQVYQELATRGGGTLAYNPATGQFTGRAAVGNRQRFETSFRKLKRVFTVWERTGRDSGMLNADVDDANLDERDDLLTAADINPLRDAADLDANDINTFSEEERAAYNERLGRERTGDEARRETASRRASRREHDEIRYRRGFGFVNRLADRTGHHVETVIFSVFLIIIGVAIAATTGIWQFIVSFACAAFYMIIPNPQNIRLIDHEDAQHLAFGSMFANRENSYNTGFGALRQITKGSAIIFFGLGLHSTFFPLSNLILLIFVFAAYFSFPIEYDPTHPDQIIGSLMRVIVALYMGIWIFGAFGGGIFQSPALGWLSIAFFLVLPVPADRENLVRAIGRAMGGITANYENIDKILFLVIMLLIGGFTLFGAGGLGITLFSGTAGIVFGVVWLIAFFSGIMTPASSRPYMGLMVLFVAFFIFGIGVGEQNIGTAFFGQWWPGIHNSVSDFIEPMGGLFEQFSNTFGQSWLLFTNPVGYAQQITSGQYVGSDQTAAAPVGLEIENFQAAGIYLGEPFSIRFEMNNRGDFLAKNAAFKLYTYIEGLTISPDPIIPGRTAFEPMQLSPEKDQFKRKLYEYGLTKADYGEMIRIEQKDIIPVNLHGMIGCDAILKQRGLFGIDKLSKDQDINKLREYYIPLTLKVDYDYNVDSTMQVDVISEEEWKRLTRDNLLVRMQKQSLISPSPVKLSIGVMDQPIKENEKIFFGLNLSTTEREDEIMEVGLLHLEIPKEWVKDNLEMKCTKEPVKTQTANYYVLDWEFKDTKAFQVFCYPQTPEIGDTPKKTFTFKASANYTLRTTKTENTLINFADSCENSGRHPETQQFYNILFPEPNDPGGEDYCATYGCDIGAGGCNNNSQCKNIQYIPNPPVAGSPNTANDLVCNTNVQPTGACCPDGSKDEACQAAFEEWILSRDSAKAKLAHDNA
ncbi:MAG: MFS transporter [Candidatus Aenigmarchaeota archaeon]|nr:MFS transporter [Candidatus Aenigmarchaeota archaeon]